MKQWSTKDLRVLVPPAEGRAGDALMTFSDRYSVFDHGVMPDRIPGKGRASCAMAVHSFGLLHDAGLATHFVEQVAADTIRIRLLGRDLSGTRLTGPARLIPLQVVYRRELRPESSVHRRIAAGALDPADVPAPDPVTGRLAADMVEFTSKFEETDRFLTRAEAARVGGVGPDDLTALTVAARRVCATVGERCERIGLTLVDGKAEFGYDDDRRLIIVDHAGTPDENRFYLGDTPVCKELLRAIHPGLRDRVQAYVRDGVPRAEWAPPAPLAPEAIGAVADVYATLAELWTTGTAAARNRLTAAARRYDDAVAAGAGSGR
ncbi:phosphoribosylaminoimidazole-succinocarboxamide synthase [Micromonospora nigra]|uniref:phosphoribosylaminoimidazolesuccinocarboxamide synthase n=1 Tax=Micromonospora nigra TaxID=145857 RepID=A0A1C6RCV1_9ACTN|nr:phosphoribosylaminoimidazole-succinocarboxamide synthase [Micromonospora nigra]